MVSSTFALESFLRAFCQSHAPVQTGITRSQSCIHRHWQPAFFGKNAHQISCRTCLASSCRNVSRPLWRTSSTNLPFNFFFFLVKTFATSPLKITSWPEINTYPWNRAEFLYPVQKYDSHNAVQVNVLCGWPVRPIFRGVLTGSWCFYPEWIPLYPTKHFAICLWLLPSSIRIVRTSLAQCCPVRLFWSHDLSIVAGSLFVKVHDPPPNPLRTRQILPATPLAFFALNTTASGFRVKKSCSVVAGPVAKLPDEKSVLFSVVISVVFSVRSSGHFDPMTLGRFEPMERFILTSSIVSFWPDGAAHFEPMDSFNLPPSKSSLP